MSSDIEVILSGSIEKTLSAMSLLEDSVSNYLVFDEDRNYTPKEREPYDALSDRFIRCVEMCIRCFKSYEKYMYGDISNTLRDSLNRMEKMSLVSFVDIWFKMRDVRNRIVHDYLPGQITRIYASIVGEFYREISGLRPKLELILKELSRVN